MAASWQTGAKRVVTLDETRLRQEMQRLWSLVVQSAGPPDALVGIATGGLHCARALSAVTSVGLFSCALRRAGTETKKKSPATRLLAHMPYAVTDRLRRYEDQKLERRALENVSATLPSPSAQLLLDVKRVVGAAQSEGLRRLLVVDDAVDSGATLGCVVQTLRESLPQGTRVMSAVLTQTRSNPMFVADYHLYDGVLCRFPWSFDFRGA